MAAWRGQVDTFQNLKAAIALVEVMDLDDGCIGRDSHVGPRLFC